MNADQVLAEVDRQLGEQRAQADAYASRAGVMMAVMALLAAFLSASLQRTGASSPGPLIWVIGIGAGVGILVLWMSRLVLGPSPSELTRWKDDTTVDDLLSAKLIAVEANSRALLRAEVVFVAQSLATVAAIAVLLVQIHGLGK